MKIFLTTLAVLSIQYGFGQKSDSLINKTLLKELGENACTCADSIDVYNKKNSEIAAGISKCIDDQTGAYQVASKLLNIDNLKKDATEKNGKKEINISINMNTESDEYKEYYFEMERYLMANCKSVKDKIAANNGQSATSISSNEEALEMYSKGIEASKQEHFQKAITYYEQALKIDPKFAFAWDNIGICYRRLENYDKALEAYQNSLKIDPNGTMPLQNIAIVYQYKKQYDKAIAAYEKLGEIDKDNPEIYYGIGNIYATYLLDYEKGLSNMCKAYNLYIKQKSPFRTDAEKLINGIYREMKLQGKEARFAEILKENNIRTQ
jgi:tetratricopeptide (TPR) repeat protein